MESNNQRLGTAPLGKLMFQLAIPTVFAQIVNLLYNMVDRIYVGRIPETGSLSLAGLGVAFPAILLISAFSALVGMGGAPRASICMGQKDHEGAERILGSSTAFLVVLSVILSVFFFWVKEPLLMLFGASENTIGYANQYLSIYLFGTIAVQISLGLNQFITCQGFAKTGMMTVLIGAVINIVLDPIFIYGFHMGVQGAALATVISQTVSAVWVVIFLCGKKSTIKIKKKYFKLDRKVLLPVLLLGISPFIMQSTECLVQLTFNTGMQSYGNDYYVGAMTILFSLSQMLFLPIQGIAQGATPIISYNFGAGNIDRVKKTVHLLFFSALFFTVAGAGIFMLVPGVFVSFFSSDPEIVRIATYGLRIYFFGFTLFGAQTAC
ncbi:MAG: MATE family efflux transporter, partial [Hungatella sp.]